jgi:hypothetical protein
MSPAPAVAPRRIAATTPSWVSRDIDPEKFSRPPAGPCLAGSVAWRMTRTM